MRSGEVDRRQTSIGAEADTRKRSVGAETDAGKASVVTCEQAKAEPTV